MAIIPGSNPPAHARSYASLFVGKTVERVDCGGQMHPERGEGLWMRWYFADGTWAQIEVVSANPGTFEPEAIPVLQSLYLGVTECEDGSPACIGCFGPLDANGTCVNCKQETETNQEPSEEGKSCPLRQNHPTSLTFTFGALCSQ